MSVRDQILGGYMGRESLYGLKDTLEPLPFLFFMLVEDVHTDLKIRWSLYHFWVQQKMTKELWQDLSEVWLQRFRQWKHSQSDSAKVGTE